MLPCRVQHFVVGDLIHELEALKRLLHSDANVLLRQRARAVRVVEVKQALLLIHPAVPQHRRENQQWAAFALTLSNLNLLHLVLPVHAWAWSFFAALRVLG